MSELGLRAPEWVTGSMIQDAVAYLRSVYPNEGCGFLKASGFIPLSNIADTLTDELGQPLDPRVSFAIDPEAWVEHDTSNDPVLAVVHSHTNGVQVPGKADMAGQAESGVPWAIMVTDGDVVGEPIWFGDQLPIPPLFGRPFVHGICDCYSLVRDAFRLGKYELISESLPVDERIYDWPYEPVNLELGPRDDNWWANGGNLYNDGFQAVGFTTIAEGLNVLPTDLRVGDCFISRMRSAVANHGGVYVGNGLILHHLTGYNSHRSVLNLWLPRIERWLRYVP